MTSPLSADFETQLPLLTILEDPARAAMYRFLAEQSGVPTITAQGALHALTQLERTPVAAVICDASMDDMSGEEFREVVQAEEHDVPVYILPQDADPQASTAPLIPSGPEMLREVLTELGTRPADLTIPMQPDIAPHLHGELLEFSLPEFLNWVAEMRFSGHWLVTVSSSQGASHPLTGHLAMRDGQLVYAECGGQTGKAALFTLLRCIETYRDAMFRFYQADLPATIRSADLSSTTQRILIELAVELDHYAAGH